MPFCSLTFLTLCILTESTPTIHFHRSYFGDVLFIYYSNLWAICSNTFYDNFVYPNFCVPSDVIPEHNIQLAHRCIILCDSICYLFCIPTVICKAYTEIFPAISALRSNCLPSLHPTTYSVFVLNLTWYSLQLFSVRCSEYHSLGRLQSTGYIVYDFQLEYP